MLSLGRPLTDALDDLDEMLAEPVTYLRSAPLVIAPAPLLRLAAWLTLPGLLVLLAAFLPEKFDWWRLGVGLGLTLLGLPWLLLAVRYRGRELILHADGVELVAGPLSLFAPWKVFHQPHRRLSRDVGGVVLPIDPSRHQAIELRRGRSVLATGKAVRLPGWTWLADDEVRLGGNWEICNGDLVDLLRLLAQRLGQEPTSPALALPTNQKEKPSSLDGRGWFVVPAGLLQLPPCCAGCAGPRDRVILLPVRARGEVRPPADRPRLAMALCEKCLRTITHRQRLGALLGAALGLVLGLPWNEWLALLGLLLGGVIGFFAARRWPVRLRRYSPSRGVVSVAFAHPLIARRTLEPLYDRPPETEPT
ncbi:MAG: hypothetical protein SNJ75_00265 [Gemmataceae bacterium]